MEWNKCEQLSYKAQEEKKKNYTMNPQNSHKIQRNTAQNSKNRWSNEQISLFSSFQEKKTMEVWYGNKLRHQKKTK